MIIKPKVRGFICLTSHPKGCKANVQSQIDYVKSKGDIVNGKKRVLVIGSSTGFGLASRIASAFGSGAATLGVMFEKKAENTRTATSGWYNTAAFEELAAAEGLYAKTINGDAFSDEIRNQTLDTIAADLGQVDLVIYSLASPRRQHPQSGVLYKSVLKPIGKTFHSSTLDSNTGVITEVTIEPASEQEVEDTVQVMGGEDWDFWISALLERNLLAQGAQTVAYSYIGPKITEAIYRQGSIGRAKDHLEATAGSLTQKLAGIDGNAYVSVNKALVTQSSSAIPVIPLYIALLYKSMKQEGLHEGCIEQMDRMYREKLFVDGPVVVDEVGRIRVDDYELNEKVQAMVSENWTKINTHPLSEIGDLNGYKEDFMRLFGFGIDGVDYEEDVEIQIPVPSIQG
jgi:enoyl-[acyl-carrier protein] reductase / trans-2-enoyl-CoA reductase (NAD+)